MHTEKSAHNAIKPINVKLQEDGTNFKVKLSNFNATTRKDTALNLNYIEDVLSLGHIFCLMTQNSPIKKI